MTEHSAEKEAPRRHPQCGSIQCATCYPGWGEEYNEAVRARITPPGKS